MTTPVTSQPTRKVGKNGPAIPVVGLGLMGAAAFYSTEIGQDDFDKLVDQAIKDGSTSFDTADIYTDISSGKLGDNERQLASYLKSHPGAREKLFIATKFVNVITPQGMGQDGSRDYAHKACRASLERLGIDYIDLYYAHRVDTKTEVEETVGALKELQEQGLIKHIGVSEYNLDQLKRAEKVAHIDALQIEFSAFSPQILENGISDWAKQNGTTIVAYSPLGRGMLTGTLKLEDFAQGDFRTISPRFSKENFPKNVELVDDIKKIAHKRGATPGQIALAWVLSKGDHIVTIPGTTKPHREQENAAAAHISLTKEEVAELDGVSFGHCWV